MIETGELLLNERAPGDRAAEWPIAEHAESAGAAPTAAPPRAPGAVVAATRTADRRRSCSATAASRAC